MKGCGFVKVSSKTLLVSAVIAVLTTLLAPMVRSFLGSIVPTSNKIVLYALSAAIYGLVFFLVFLLYYRVVEQKKTTPVLAILYGAVIGVIIALLGGVVKSSAIMLVLRLVLFFGAGILFLKKE